MCIRDRNVAIAAQPVTEALGRVLVRGAHLTLAFSSEGVFAGTTPQHLHPYDAPWLAHRLVDRGVASLEFGGQLAPADAAALIAWLALLLPPLLASLFLIAGFIAHYRQDRRLASVAGLPLWYLPLRLRLSVVACLCLALGGLSGFWSYPESLLPVVLT